MATDIRMLEGRTIKLSLSKITRNIKDQNKKITLKVNKYSESTAQTFVKKIQIPDASIKRFVRKGTTKIADSFLALTKDQKTIRIKPVVITRNKITGKQKKFLRKKVRISIKKMVSEYTYDDLIQAIVFQRFQKEIRNLGLKKISPVKYSDIRTIELLSKEEIKKAEKEGEEVEKEVITKEEKIIEKEIKQETKEIEKEEQPVSKEEEKSEKTEE